MNEMQPVKCKNVKICTIAVSVRVAAKNVGHPAAAAAAEEWTPV